MTLSLAGKRAIITGAAGGMGRAVAVRFAEAGARVALCDINRAGLEETAKTINSSGGFAFSECFDLSDIRKIEHFITTSSEALGGLDIVYNNAGISVIRPIEECDEALWDLIQNINVKAYFFIVRAALPYLRKSPSPTIINVGSMAGVSGVSGSVAYCASKGGVHQLTRAMAVELAPENIRVNGIAPGLIDTEMVTASLSGLPLEQREAIVSGWAARQLFKRAGHPNEIASIALFLASSEASFLTGEIVNASGGWAAA